MTDLFTPMDLNGLALPNRIWMSAMTRTRATGDNIPTPLMGEYHGQRAMTGLAQARYGPGCLPCARRRRWPSGRQRC